MTPLDALLELLERVGASRSAAALVSEEELSHWPAEAVPGTEIAKATCKGESGSKRGLSRLRAAMHYAGANRVCRNWQSSLVLVHYLR